ncbi:MAG: c-type cytochrome, partial [Gaiellaceae bacterium]
APRRFAVLPSEYEDLSKWALPVAAVLGAAQILFLINIVQTVRGVAPRSAPVPWRRGDFVAVGVLCAAVVGLAVPVYVAVDALRGDESATSTQTTSTTPRDPGAAVFASAGCGSCHTLEKAGASATIGPNLGETDLNADQIARTVKDGRQAKGMPSFAGQLSDEQIRRVAEYVAAK